MQDNGTNYLDDKQFTTHQNGNGNGFNLSKIVGQFAVASLSSASHTCRFDFGFWKDTR